MSASLYLFIVACFAPKEHDGVVWLAWFISLFITFK